MECPVAPGVLSRELCSAMRKALRTAGWNTRQRMARTVKADLEAVAAAWRLLCAVPSLQQALIGKREDEQRGVLVARHEVFDRREGLREPGRRLGLVQGERRDDAESCAGDDPRGTDAADGGTETVLRVWVSCAAVVYHSGAIDNVEANHAIRDEAEPDVACRA